MQEIQKLLAILKVNLGFIYLSYQEAFEKYYNINPHDICLSELQALVRENIVEIQGFKNPTISILLVYFFSYKIKKTSISKILFILSMTIQSISQL